MNYMNCICQVSFSEPTLAKVAELRAAVLELLGKTKPGTPLGTLGTPVRSIDLSTWTAAAWNLQETHGHTSDTSWLRDVQSFNLAAVVRVRSNSSAACSAACFWMFLYLRANNGPMYESCMNHDSSWLRSYCYDFHLLGGFPLSTQRTSWVSTGLDLGSDSQPFSIKRSGLWLVACGLDDDLAGCAICGVHTCRSHYSLDTTAERQDHWCTEEFSEGAFCAGPVQSEVRHYGIPVRLPRPLESCVVLCRDCQIVFHSSLSFRSCGWNRLIWQVIYNFLTAADCLSVCSWGLNRLLCDLFRLEVPDTVG